LLRYPYKDNNHPAGDKLASDHGATYKEVMAWFCQGFGFGEIELAYSISEQASVPVTSVFTLRISGLG
jgi:hypothetical protein